jgi:hypothetical protein
MRFALALRLGLAQSQVSRRVRALEGELGVERQGGWWSRAHTTS